MKRDMIFQYVLMVPLAYGLVFSLYIINKPHALKIKEPAANIDHILNQGMLRGADYRYLMDMKHQGMLPDRGTLREFEDYFQLVVGSFPDQPDSYGMLGYCQYYLGQESHAIRSYGTAILSNPDFMGYYYNLAVIYYNRGGYVQAAVFAKRALEVPLSAEIRSILSSDRIYRLILAQMPGDISQNIIQNITEERQKELRLLELSTAQLNDPIHSPEKAMALELI